MNHHFAPHFGLSRRALTALMLLLFVAALAVRLAGIVVTEPQADESVWLRRSEILLNKLQISPTKATSHLGHPGIPPALMMASGLWLRQATAGRTLPGTNLPVYPTTKLVAARVPVCFIAALLAPVVFIGFYYLVGTRLAIASALIAAFDPRTVSLGCLAHVDALLTLFISAAILLYALAEKRDSMLLRLLAGVAWGLAFATKIPAVTLVCGLILYRLLAFLFIRRPDGSRRTLFEWGDVWAVLAGHVVFTLLFTRLWTHASEYLRVLRIRVYFAGWLWRRGVELQHHTWLFILVALLLVSLIILVRLRATSTRLKHHVSHAGAVGLFLWTVMFVIPQVPENFVRLWKLLFALSGEAHDGFGAPRAPAAYGYLTLFLTHVPDLVLLGAGLGMVWMLIHLCRAERGFDLRAPLLLCVVCALLWISAFNLSDKQAWRYAVPVFPCIAVFAAVGLTWVFRRFTVPVLALYFALLLIGWHPYLNIYFNSISGGLTQANVRGSGYDFAGQRPALRYLFDAQDREQLNPLHLTVFGSSDSVNQATVLYFGEARRAGLRIGFYPRQYADYVFVYQSHQHLVAERNWQDVFTHEPVYTFSFQGAPVISVFKAPYPDYETGLTVEINDLHARTGEVRYIRSLQQKVRRVIPGRSKQDFVLFSNGFRLPAGTYRFSVIARGVDGGPFLRPGTSPALHMKVGGCQRTVTQQEIGSDLTEVPLLCTYAREVRAFPQIEWLGEVPLEVLGLKIVAEKTAIGPPDAQHTLSSSAPQAAG